MICFVRTESEDWQTFFFSFDCRPFFQSQQFQVDMRSSPHHQGISSCCMFSPYYVRSRVLDLFHRADSTDFFLRTIGTVFTGA